MLGFFTRERAPANMRREDGVTGTGTAFLADASGTPIAFITFGPVGLRVPVDPGLPDTLLSHETMHKMGLGRYLQRMALNLHVA
jgi:hypothetical protein